MRAAHPDGVDAVLDAVPLGPQLVGAVRDGGALVSVLPGASLPSERSVRVDTVGVEPHAEQLRALVADLAAGRLRVRVAETLPLAEAAEGHRRAAKGGLRGKIVLTV